MKEAGEYAVPLFAIVDESKVDLSKPLPDTFGEQLGMYLNAQFGIKSLSSPVMLLEGVPYLILHGVPPESLPPLCSLIDVQKSQLFRYEREDQETVVLTPLNVKID